MKTKKETATQYPWWHVILALRRHRPVKSLSIGVAVHLSVAGARIKVGSLGEHHKLASGVWGKATAAHIFCSIMKHMLGLTNVLNTQLCINPSNIMGGGSRQDDNRAKILGVARAPQSRCLCGLVLDRRWKTCYDKISECLSCTTWVVSTWHLCHHHGSIQIFTTENRK